VHRNQPATATARHTNRHCERPSEGASDRYARCKHPAAGLPAAVVARGRERDRVSLTAIEQSTTRRPRPRT
jgi:hypothetical protein